MGGMAQGGGNPFASLLGALGQQGGSGQAPQSFSWPSPASPGMQQQGGSPATQPSLLQQVGMGNLQRGAQQQQGFQQAQADAQKRQREQEAAQAAAQAKAQQEARAAAEEARRQRELKQKAHRYQRGQNRAFSGKKTSFQDALGAVSRTRGRDSSDMRGGS